ncbi:MAG: TfoX/Sxy family DNA transformation protein [Zoogloea sp.]|uniref:TfoX/Sxy family DNA transformation protein n=1 Tax=Zoogloea sp. TaxID=49181 RepID=UPI003F392923
MATDADFAAHVLEQLAELGGMSTRRMFGEYALYRYGQVVGLLCDNQMFLKPTEAAQALLTEPAYGHPFPGARPHLLVNELLDDRESLAKLVRVTSENLPASAPRKPRKTHATKADGTTPVGRLPNLGPKSARMLADAGIRTLAELQALGAVRAYARIKATQPGASLNLLWALEGALTGSPWQTVAREHRASLLLALDSLSAPLAPNQ